MSTEPFWLCSNEAVIQRLGGVETNCASCVFNIIWQSELVLKGMVRDTMYLNMSYFQSYYDTSNTNIVEMYLTES